MVASPPDRPAFGPVDSHVHVFDPTRAYPADAGYVPPPHEALGLDDLAAVLDAAGIARAVLVQPSAYGTDNGVLLDALKGGAGRWAGVGVVSPTASPADVERLRRAGVSGLRLNLQQSAGLYAATGALEHVAMLTGRLDMALHLQCHARDLARTLPRLDQARTVILDHLGFPEPGVTNPAIYAALAADPRIFVKLSGAFRLSREKAPHADIDRYARAALTAFGPSRSIWGSDWPFVNAKHRPRHAQTLEMLERWLPQPAQRQEVLVSTPMRLFFKDAA